MHFLKRPQKTSDFNLRRSGTNLLLVPRCGPASARLLDEQIGTSSTVLIHFGGGLFQKDLHMPSDTHKNALLTLRKKSAKRGRVLFLQVAPWRP